MRKKSIFISLLIVLGIIISIGLFSFISTIKKPFTVEQSESIVIQDGESFYGVLNKLDNGKKIKNINFIKLYVKMKNLTLNVLPGEYTVNSEISVEEFITMLNEGQKQDEMSITIPEGFTVDDIGLKLEAIGLCTLEEFGLAVDSYPLPSYVSDNSAKKYNLEGFLFPDTYTITSDFTPEDIIDMMVKRFEEVWAENTEELNIAESEIEHIINIAAMIEKEAKVDGERELVSSVIHNRLEIDMPLQICATVIYAHGYNIEDIRESHLEIDSLYNTYIYNSLPAGPISNPGIKSIMAAINPVESDYLFYLLEGEGEHFFTSNYDDFLSKKEELGY